MHTTYSQSISHFYQEKNNFNNYWITYKVIFMIPAKAYHYDYEHQIYWLYSESIELKREADCP